MSAGDGHLRLRVIVNEGRRTHGGASERRNAGVLGLMRDDMGGFSHGQATFSAFSL